VDARTTLLFLCLAAGPFGACSRQPAAAPDTSALGEAVRLQEDHRFEDAMAAYERLLRSTEDREIRAKAELGVAVIQRALDRRDRALKSLEDLPAEVDHLALAAVEYQIRAVMTEFEGTSFAAEVRAAGLAALTHAAENAERHRGVQARAVAALVDRGEYTGALEYLRTLEAERAPTDRRDIAEMLVNVRLRSDEDADRVLESFHSRLESDPRGAVAFLDEEMARFRGTRAYARLLDARLRADSKLPASPPEEDEEEQSTDND